MGKSIAVTLDEAIKSGRRFRAELETNASHGWYSDAKADFTATAHCNCKGGRTHRVRFIVEKLHFSRFVLELTEAELLNESRKFLSSMRLKLEKEAPPYPITWAPDKCFCAATSHPPCDVCSHSEDES